MRIWIDADSCPPKVRAIICKAAVKRNICAWFVANRDIPVTKADQIRMIVVEAAADEADRYILERAVPGDLVISRDIPFCADLVEKQVSVMNDRGDLFTKDNIGARLLQRNRMMEMRAMGLAPPPSPPFGDKEVKAFANLFDRELTRLSISSHEEV